MPRGPARAILARKPALQDAGPEAVSGRRSPPGGVARQRREPVEVEEEEHAVGTIAPEAGLCVAAVVREGAPATDGEERALFVWRDARSRLRRGFQPEVYCHGREGRSARAIESEREQPRWQESARTMDELTRAHVSQGVDVERPGSAAGLECLEGGSRLPGCPHCAASAKGPSSPAVSASRARRVTSVVSSRR